MSGTQWRRPLSAPAQAPGSPLPFCMLRRARGRLIPRHRRGRLFCRHRGRRLRISEPFPLTRKGTPISAVHYRIQAGSLPIHRGLQARSPIRASWMFPLRCGLQSGWQPFHKSQMCSRRRMILPIRKVRRTPGKSGKLFRTREPCPRPFSARISRHVPPWASRRPCLLTGSRWEPAQDVLDHRVEHGLGQPAGVRVQP